MAFDSTPCLLILIAAALPYSICMYQSESISGGSTTEYYTCNGVRVNPPSYLVPPKAYSRCCNGQAIDARTHGCCGSIQAYKTTRYSSDYSYSTCCGINLLNDDEVCCDGEKVQSKKKGFKNCCSNSTKGVCDDELECWSTAADCAIQHIPFIGVAYGAASAISSAFTDKSVSQWFIESALLDDVPESDRRQARNNVDTLVNAPSLASISSSVSRAWKQLAVKAANAVGQVAEIAQFAKNLASGETDLGSVVKHFVSMLDSEKDNIGKLVKDKNPKLAGNKFLSSLRRMPFACIAALGIDCGNAYLFSLFRGKRNTQIKQRLHNLYAKRELAKLLFYSYDRELREALLELQEQELGDNPYLATDSLMKADVYWNSTLDGTTAAEILLNQSEIFFNVLKRAVQSNSERGVRIGAQERNDLLAASKNRSTAVEAVDFLANGIVEYVESWGLDGFIAAFDRRLRNLDRQISNVTLTNVRQFLGNFNSTLVDMKSAVILTKRDGSRIYAAVPVVPSGNTSTPLFVTFLALPSQYKIQSAIRVSKRAPTTLVTLREVPEGVMFTDIYDDEKLTYFLTVKPTIA